MQPPAPSSTSTAVPAVAAAPIIRPKILVADDSLLNRKLLLAILAKEQCTVIEAVDGIDALAKAHLEVPDLVLLDIMMPGLDGYEVCRQLKADPKFASIPVIVLSALNQPADKVRALELGAVDYVTKPFDRGEVLARVRNQLQIRKLTASLVQANRDLVAKQKDLDADLRAAADIQSSLIPRSSPDVNSLDMAWRFVPCSTIGGDIFNVVPLDDDHLAIYVVDVSGHGVPAAMVTVSVAQSLTQHAGIVIEPRSRRVEDGAPSVIRAPSNVLELLDEEFPMDRFDKYFTMVYMVLNTKTGVVRYCNAAHPQPIVLRRGGRVELMEAGGTIVGLGGVMPYDEGELVLEYGDRIFMFTDGIAEFTSESGEEYGEQRLAELLCDRSVDSVQAACDGVVSALGDFGRGRPPNDDITVLGLEFLGTVG
jgi:sigma-B regulation protein RsbU (phosphoserine phosphatase)